MPEGFEKPDESDSLDAGKTPAYPGTMADQPRSKRAIEITFSGSVLVEVEGTDEELAQISEAITDGDERELDGLLRDALRVDGFAVGVPVRPGSTLPSFRVNTASGYERLERVRR